MRIFGIVSLTLGRLCPLIFLRSSRGVILCVTHRDPFPQQLPQTPKLLLCSLCVSSSALHLLRQPRGERVLGQHPQDALHVLRAQSYIAGAGSDVLNN